MLWEEVGFSNSIHAITTDIIYCHDAQSLFTQARRVGPAYSQHHHELKPPKSPLTTRHMHSPSSHHRMQASGNTSFGSSEEEQHKVPPQKKAPMLPPTHSPGTHGHKHLPWVSDDSEHNRMQHYSVQILLHEYLYFVHRSCSTYSFICFSTI